MESMRTPFQGVYNIVHFNWHFYVLSIGFVFVTLVLTSFLSEEFLFFSYVICCLIMVPTIFSLLVSYYIYDRSGLYDLNWLGESGIRGKTVNIHAGFDETSSLLNEKFKFTDFMVLDFYDPSKHTEISIKRARAAYPAFPGTKQVTAANLPLGDQSMDNIFVLFSAHEIRNETERIKFFKELNRVIKPTGKIFIMEHLRDAANFIAYTVGFFHFYSKAAWFRAFRVARLAIQDEVKYTPFISIFVLKSNDAAC